MTTGIAPDKEDQGLPFGALAFAGAIGSLITCYGSIVLTSFFGAEPLGINAHVQAVVMWAFGSVALWALWMDRRRHGRTYPLAVAGAGLAILLFALYVHYDQRFEVLAYVLLVVGALLNQKAMVSTLYDTVVEQADEIRGFNQTLERRVETQVGEIERLSRLKEFLAPSIAELVVAEGKEDLLKSHRQYIACLISDIRDFTALSEALEPEDTIELLRAYHEMMGRLAHERGGSIGHRAGDGVMVFFNDPVPCDEPVLEAVRLALDIREAWEEVRAPWQRRGHPIGVGIGLAAGYATLGLLGDHGRSDYTAIGPVVNVTARLCDVAGDGEILIDRRAYSDVEERVEAEACEPLDLKGIREPIPAWRVTGLRT